MNRLLADLADTLGDGWEAPTEVATTDVLPSPLAVTELAVGAVGAAGLAASALSHARGGPRPAVHVEGRVVSAVFRSDRLVSVDGQPVTGFAELSRFWPTHDGWVRTHANYPHHRDRLLDALALPREPELGAVAARLADLTSTDAEARIVAAGGIAAAVRTPDEWRAHPQAAAVRTLPLLSTTRLHDAPPRRLAPPPRAPLLPASGLRVLDLTRVIAGPVATSTLGLLGADVLRIDPPRAPELPDMYLLTCMGKRSALVDFDRDRAVLDGLVREADVVVTGYRPGALDRHGLAPDELARVNPGVVVASLSAWGDVGPWGDRRGFDSIVQAASGIASIHRDDDGTPGALPAQALDYATGFVLAAGILAAVARQQRDGGALLVRAHLARTAQWLLDHPDATDRALPDVDDLLHRRTTDLGVLRAAPPAVQFDDAPIDWAISGHRWGADRAEWLPR